MAAFAPYSARLRILFAVSAFAFVADAGLLSLRQLQSEPLPRPVVARASVPAPIAKPVGKTDATLPAVLSQKDVALYQSIASAQKSANWSHADVAIAQLDNPVLVGDMLAERYTNHHYTATSAQLSAWLSQYGDHPQYGEIYAIAIAKNPALKNTLPAAHHAALQGYGDDNALASDDGFGKTWHAGIEAWRADKKAEAAKLFSSMLAHEDELSSWNVSAAAYWAYRAYNAIGNHNEAAKYLLKAADEPRSFYGILARQQLSQSLDLDNTPPTLSESDLLEMIGEPPVKRILALGQTGMSDLAEKELRALFPQENTADKMRLLALAHKMNLASVQIVMAKQLEHDGRTLDFAKYPTPGWQPVDGFKIDPALLYALMKQESGFRASAVSPYGALGLMQLMPRTAVLMQRGVPGNPSEPALNMTLGQNYVQHLLDNSLVEGNLLYMLAAYNAGAGRLQEWKTNVVYHNDPLLFIESIPFAQTRHYVMQVMTNYWIYSELAGKPSRSIMALLSSRWPSYDIEATPLAARSHAHGTEG